MSDRQTTYEIKLVTNEVVEVYGEPIVRDGVLTVMEWYGLGGGAKRQTSFSLVNVLWWRAKAQR